jgi:[phosphatase 2A protein]-leucine-carboxy methyltransferase
MNNLQNAGKTCQIINLGCGFDTLYFRLKSSNVHFSRYIEIDFSSVTAKKIRLICKPGSPDLISMFDQMRAYLLLWIKLGIYANLYTVTMIFQICIIQIDILADIKTAAGHTELHTTDYHLIGADLRQINELNDKLLSTGIDFTLPTIVVCECVLIYMTPQQSAQLISYFADRFQCIGVINNEQVHTHISSIFVQKQVQMNLDDKFGEIMQQNLHIRGIKLAGHSACQTVETHKNRYMINMQMLIRKTIYVDFWKTDGHRQSSGVWTMFTDSICHKKNEKGGLVSSSK